MLPCLQSDGCWWGNRDPNPNPNPNPNPDPNPNPNNPNPNPNQSPNPNPNPNSNPDPHPHPNPDPIPNSNPSNPNQVRGPKFDPKLHTGHIGWKRTSYALHSDDGSKWRSMATVPLPWQRPSSAPVPPQGAPGGSGRLGTPR